MSGHQLVDLIGSRETDDAVALQGEQSTKTDVPGPLLDGVLGRLAFKRGAPARDDRTDMPLTG